MRPDPIQLLRQAEADLVLARGAVERAQRMLTNGDAVELQRLRGLLEEIEAGLGKLRRGLTEESCPGFPNIRNFG